MSKEILHVQVGNENWEPNSLELDEIKRLFEEALLDPAGNSILHTREGIEVVDTIEVNNIKFIHLVGSEEITDPILELYSKKLQIALLEENHTAVFITPNNIRISFIDYKNSETKDNDTFNSGEGKRLVNNPVDTENYTGPDDVSLRYRTLSDKEKEDMKEVKLLAQGLINKIRSLRNDVGTVIIGSDKHERLKQLDTAIEKVVEASMWSIKFVTGPK